MKVKHIDVKTLVIVFLSALTALSVFVVIKGWMGGHFDSIDTLRIYIASFGLWAPIILLLIQMLQVVLPVLPGMMGCVAGAALFGAMGGFWVNYIGISAGSIAAFCLARMFGLRLAEKMISFQKYDGFIKRMNRSKSYPVFLFLSILLPLAPDDFLCYFSGLTNMSLKKFTAIVLLGKPWCILVYSFFFAYFI